VRARQRTPDPAALAGRHSSKEHPPAPLPGGYCAASRSNTITLMNEPVGRTDRPSHSGTATSRAPRHQDLRGDIDRRPCHKHRVRGNLFRSGIGTRSGFPTCPPGPKCARRSSGKTRARIGRRPAITGTDCRILCAFDCNFRFRVSGGQARAVPIYPLMHQVLCHRPDCHRHQRLPSEDKRPTGSARFSLHADQLTTMDRLQRENKSRLAFHRHHIGKPGRAEGLTSLPGSFKKTRPFGNGRRRLKTASGIWEFKRVHQALCPGHRFRDPAHQRIGHLPLCHLPAGFHWLQWQSALAPTRARNPTRCRSSRTRRPNVPQQVRAEKTGSKPRQRHLPDFLLGQLPVMLESRIQANPEPTQKHRFQAVASQAKSPASRV